MSERKTPWTEGEWQRKGHAIVAYGRGTIATCPTVGNGGVFESLSNARLISKAPELVGLLERLVEGPPHWDKDGMHEEDLRNDARALLSSLAGEDGHG
jgi:hypothetical protein